MTLIMDTKRETVYRKSLVNDDLWYFHADADRLAFARKVPKRGWIVTYRSIPINDAPQPNVQMAFNLFVITHEQRRTS